MHFATLLYFSIAFETFVLKQRGFQRGGLPKLIKKDRFVRDGSVNPIYLVHLHENFVNQMNDKYVFCTIS